MHESLPDSDAVLAQFNRLIQELLRGSMNRNTFRPWEVELLLDIEACHLRDSSRRETLRRYQRAVYMLFMQLVVLAHPCGDDFLQIKRHSSNGP